MAEEGGFKWSNCLEGSHCPSQEVISPQVCISCVPAACVILLAVLQPQQFGQLFTLSLQALQGAEICRLALFEEGRRGSSFLLPLQCSYTVPVDLSLFLDTPLTPLPRHSASPTAKTSGVGGVGVDGGSSQSGREGRGKSSGEDGKGRRETKRKLLDALEPFAPKRRSSRVRVSLYIDVHVCMCVHSAPRCCQGLKTRTTLIILRCYSSTYHLG